MAQLFQRHQKVNHQCMGSLIKAVGSTETVGGHPGGNIMPGIRKPHLVAVLGQPAYTESRRHPGGTCNIPTIMSAGIVHRIGDIVVIIINIGESRPHVERQ